MNDQTQDDRAFARSTAPVLILVALLAAIHLVRQALDPATDFRLLADLAFVPANVTFAFDRTGVLEAASAAITGGAMERDELAIFVGGGLRWWTPFTYAFLHGSFAHIALNAVWLLAFGSAVCRRFGGLRFNLLLAVAAIFGALAHYLAHPFGLAPVIGASAGISGAMGAAVRFAFAPGAPLGAGFARSRDLLAYRMPAPPLRAVLAERRAITFIAIWFVTNLAFGVYAPLSGGAPIAWEAHIGCFVAGFLLFSLFDPPAALQ
ncbi:MAG: rhomboid family intramembrane serine protease [Hyphomicrobiales bacterium]|nr:rhomboid family intramembrane serine protease [Hyphomicrobiales bacterium]